MTRHSQLNQIFKHFCDLMASNCFCNSLHAVITLKTHLQYLLKTIKFDRSHIW